MDVNVATNRNENVPPISGFLSAGFRWYVPRYFRRHFNAIRLAKDSLPLLPDGKSVICFVNHPSWWDPLFAVFLTCHSLGGRQFYAPIDKESLKRYAVFRKLGFFGVSQGSLDGAKQFLRIGQAILDQRNTALWITPSGSFTDVRSRSIFEPGLAHFAANIKNVILIPVAFEYAFWEERNPEALVEFGRIVDVDHEDLSKEEWHCRLEDSLAEVQGSLAAKTIQRDATQFDILLDGTAGVGGPYDLLRHLKAAARGQTFDARHRSASASACASSKGGKP